MRNGGKWTESRYQSFVKSVLRSGSRKWPPKFEALNAAKRGKQVNVKTGWLAEHYECAECHKRFPAKDIQVDHVVPVVPVTGFETWDNVIENLFCEADNLQVLCKPCHKLKSQKERQERSSYNKNKAKK